MVVRNIVEIDKEKCNGCGLCVDACHEHAIEMVNGKAQLIKDDYCDGLGDCLPACPTDAIKIIKREAVEYDEETVLKRIEEKKAEKENQTTGGCPGSMQLNLNQGMLETRQGCPGNQTLDLSGSTKKEEVNVKVQSQLQQWPVQMKLVSPNAPYFEGADLLIGADCTAFAYGDFHNEFIKGRVTLIGCPKLDDNEYYVHKIADILKANNIKSITVARMSVPCCSGISQAVEAAIRLSGKQVEYTEAVISVEGNRLK